MKTRVLIPLFLRQFALSLAMLCLFAQALVPSGFMLAPGEDGFPVSVVICGQPGAVLPAAVAGAESGEEIPADQDRNLAPCAFAGVAQAAAPASDPAAALYAPLALARADFPPAMRQAALSIGANAPPPSRAPPVSV